MRDGSRLDRIDDELTGDRIKGGAVGAPGFVFCVGDARRFRLLASISGRDRIGPFHRRLRGFRGNMGARDGFRGAPDGVMGRSLKAFG
ncbi:hypothetical protein KCP77_15915 [Salmonella enterica subsp. enterica]|nr:hypothetical protein KCP77_15915 [Salmonella enterica subsp. enterica]